MTLHFLVNLLLQTNLNSTFAIILKIDESFEQ